MPGSDELKAKKAKAGGAPAHEGAASGTDNPTGDEDKPGDGEDKPGKGDEKPAAGEDKPPEGEAKPAAAAEATEEQKLQDSLREAHERGLPAVVVFGSRSAQGTQQLLSTLDRNMKEGKADYIYVDTDRLDPNSELGRVARRSEEQGLGLGADGKSSLAFTGVYKVDKGEDGQFHLGNSVATFWGGRPDISRIMDTQLGYATRDVSGGGAPPADRLPPAPPADAPRPAADGNPQTDAQRAQAEAAAKARAEAEARASEAQAKAAKEAAEAERVKQFSDKPYTMDQYKEGWGRFLDRAGMEAGPMRDLVDGFGQQVLSGQLDEKSGKQLGDLMGKVDNLERGSAAQMLSQVNAELADNQVSMRATVGKDGKIESMEMKSQDGSMVKVDRNGVVTVSNTAAPAESPEQISLRLAKRIEPDACP